MTMDHIRNIGTRLTSYSTHANNQNNVVNNEDIVIKGILAKRKNMKNRYFVLRRETSQDLPARLEYYDSEKKFLEGCQPKKKYILKDCFSIGRKPDKKNCVIALYVNKDCIGLVAENESELQKWLQKLQEHRNSGMEPIGGPRVEYEHVWHVEVLQRSFATSQNLTGQHWLCLTSRFLSLVKEEDPKIKRDFQLDTIIKCGVMNHFFFFELGKLSGIGSGQLFMEVEDSFIAQNINNSVTSAMNNFGRTSSVSESDIRRRTNSDPQSDVPSTRSRGRCDSVPNNPRNHHTGTGMSLDKIHQHFPDHQDGRFGSDEDGPIPALFDEELEQSQEHLSSSRNTFSNLKSPSECNEYMAMDSCSERQPPNSLRLSPRTTSSIHSGIVSPGSEWSMSPSIGIVSALNYVPMGPIPSPQASTGSHSRNASQLDDAYVSMLSPGAQGSQLTQGQSAASSPYMEMGPGPTASVERWRTTSTPTPIPLSPSDEDSCYDIFGNSGSSSCTSGTPSDQRIHDIAGDDRGSTPHGGMWADPHNDGEDLDCIGGPRPIRTNSVGSKPDQFKRKNRLDAPPPSEEPARLRAFSLGSRMSAKFGVCRHGVSGHHQGTEHLTGGLGDIFPSIKECGKQAKSKSSSAPMLGASPISHSWSGTPGAYFRGFSQSRNAARETNLMELDFSKNKSCDVIPSEDKKEERRTSKERLWHTFTGHRHRSNSKSSGGSNTRLGVDSSWGSGKEKRLSENDGCSTRGVEIPLKCGGDPNDYLELDFTPSPRSSGSDPMKGYLPMHPPALISSSLTSASEFLSERRGQRTTSLNETYLEMSSSRSSCASNDGYVDMTGGGGGSSGGLTIASSSSSSTSINALPSTSNRARRPNLCAPVTVTSQELPSPLEDPVLDEDYMVGEVGFGTEGRKKKSKGSKRRPLREGSKRKKSDSGPPVGESPEVGSKSKASGAFLTLTNLITRKPSTNSNPKIPLSPKGSPLPPKGSKESTSPFSSLKRTKTRDKEDRETNSLAGEVCSPPVTPSSPNSISPQCSQQRRIIGTSDNSPPPASHKGEEKMMFGPLEASRLRRQTSREADRRRSAYNNSDLPLETTSGSMPALHVLQRPPSTVGAVPLQQQSPDTRSYVNMQPGISSPHLSPLHRDIAASLQVSQGSSPPSTAPQTTTTSTLATSPAVEKPAPEDNYMLMSVGGVEKNEPRASTMSTEVARCPEIPRKLLSSHSHPPSLALEKLSLHGDRPPSSASERSRSHSGPGTSEVAKSLKRTDDGRAASACSSPVSYSPPTSPTLGSMSSMSSLSEGGLSSASSTCTVVNVGTKTPAGVAPKPVTIQPSPHPPAAEPSLPAPAPDAKPISAGEDGSLNYVALDLGSASGSKNSRTSSPRLAHRGAAAIVPVTDEAPLSYVEIDFKKSEGLRNTSLERDANRTQ